MTTRNLSLLDLKVEIKKWENDFLEKNNRKPCKNDIENAQDSIKRFPFTSFQYQNDASLVPGDTSIGELVSYFNASSYKLKFYIQCDRVLKILICLSDDNALPSLISKYCSSCCKDWLSRCNPQKEIAPVDHVSVNQMDFQPKLSPKNQTLKRNHFASYEKETADSRLSQCSIEVSSIDHKQSYENSPSTIQKSTEKRTKVTEESCTEMFVEDIVNSEPKIKISEPFSKKIPCEDNQNDISELKSEHELISKVNCPRSDCDEENSTQTKSTSEPVKRRKVVHKSPDEKVSGLSSKKVSSLER
ncbi:hypothetical protein GQR58_025454 [Nymphon striatum]|nr:hypothetical protein GQR58_025454 [Nymphon striatum]